MKVKEQGIPRFYGDFTMSLYTQEPVLFQTTQDDFYKLADFWGRDGLIVRGDTLVSRLEDPIQMPLISSAPEEDYATLIGMLLEHPDVDQICVRTGAGWVKEYARRMTRSRVEHMADLAAHAPEKIHFLEMKYRARGENMAEPRYTDRPVIEFVEDQTPGKEAIVGYQMVIPAGYEDLFTIIQQSEGRFVLSHGIWVPTRASPN